jgi:hypothetical protein
MAPTSVLTLADAGNKFEDLSGVEIKPGENPYDALINACHGSPVSHGSSNKEMRFIAGVGFGLMLIQRTSPRPRYSLSMPLTARQETLSSEKSSCSPNSRS